MGTGQILKKAPFGGFKKEGVLDYIEQLESELHTAKAAAPAVQERNAAYNAAVEEVRELEVKITELEDENALSKKLIEGLKRESDELQKRIGMYEARIHEYENGKKKLEQTDEQIGNLVTDAVVYSERVKAQARAESKQLCAKTKRKIEDTALSISAAQSELLKVKEDFFSGFSEAFDRLTALSNEVRRLASQLDTDANHSPN